jgi:hypothetical protein
MTTVNTRHFRRAVRSWQSFHADTGAQIAVAHALMTVPALYLAIDAVVRWTRFPVPLGVQVGIAVALYATLLWRHPLGTGQIPGRVAAVTAGTLAATWVVAAILYDTSFDGESYHLPALLALADGWNPFYATTSVTPANLQANGMWTVRAALLAVTGSVEGAKAVNMVFPIAALFTLVPAWSLLRGRALTVLELALVYSAVGNPVALGQVFTFYVDGTVYECGLVVLAAVLLAGSAYRRAALGLICASIVLITGAKITGLYYAPVLAAVAGLVVWRRVAAPRRVAALVLGTLAVAVLAIGFRPYVTNPRDYGHLVELGIGADIGRPAEYQNLPPPMMLAASIFVRTDVDAAPRLKLPLVVTPHELASMGAPSPRDGGFGPFFALEIVLALLASGIVLMRDRGRTLGDPAFVIAFGLAVMTAAFPEPWWARFAPFFWGVPIFLALGVGGRSKFLTLCAACVIALALVNGGVAFAGNLARTVAGDYRLRTLFGQLAALHEEVLIVPVLNRGFELTAAHRLAGAGIPFRVGTPELPIRSGSAQCARLIRTDRLLYCLPAKASD